MRRYILLALPFLLLACTTSEGFCGEHELPLEFGGCCDDLDADGACDPVIVPEVNTTEEAPVENETVALNDTVPVVELPEPEPVDERSLTEQYRDEFWELAQSFSYYVDTEEYGRLWVWLEEDTIQYLPVDNSFIVERREVLASEYSHVITYDRTLDMIEDRFLPVVNYVVLDRSKNQYDGCFVDGTFYSMADCVEDWPNNNPVIHYELEFNAPDTPLDWLARFDGRAPTDVQYNRTFRFTEAGGQVLVDEVTFGRTKLYVHNKFKAPLQVDQLDGSGAVRDRITFYGPAFNQQDQPLDSPRLEERYRYG